jgi:Protein of unknown function
MLRRTLHGSQAARRLILLTMLVFAGLLPPPSHAHTKGMYKTRAAAEKRARELKCEGAFQMGSLWMPCANEQALHKALQNN